MNDRFEALRVGFLERCRGQLSTLEALAGSEDTSARGDAHELLARTAHSLAGAGGSARTKKKTGRAHKPAARARKRAHAA